MVRFVRSDMQLDEPLLAPLFDDVVKCEELLEEADSQFAKRAFVRASFAWHEGALHWFKKIVSQWLISGMGKTGDLNVSAFLLLQDEFHRPNRQGKIESERNRIPFLNLLAFVIRKAAEITNADATELFGDNGWCEVQKALKVRDRITHPKTPEDLNITPEEIESTRESLRWLFNCWVRIVKSAARFK